jgi:hypothetical protein
MIIDAHMHLGGSAISGLNISEADIISTMDRAGIDASIVQPFPYPPGPVQEVHDSIARFAAKHPHRIFGMASISPHLPADDYRREAERCIKELGFVGLKLHPLGHLAPILSRAADVFFETASWLTVPAMIHTGFGVPFTLPALAIPRARQYPNLQIILAHAGESLYSEEALVAAGECENIHLETSWSKPGEIRHFLRKLGGGRVMMGSDLPDNTETEITKYRSIDIGEEERAAGLGLTAIRIFRLQFDD